MSLTGAPVCLQKEAVPAEQFNLILNPALPPDSRQSACSRSTLAARH